MELRDTLLAAARALDPVRPTFAIEKGLYVEPPDGGIHGRIVRWCHRDPTAHLLVLGGIGSGKTTELSMAHRTLSTTTGLRAWHVEFDRYFDLGEVTEGRLVNLAGLAILNELVARGESLLGGVRDAAHLLHAAVKRDMRELPALLRREFMHQHVTAPAMAAADIARDVAPLVQAWQRRREPTDGIVLLIDALDRRPFTDFVEATRSDLGVLREFGVGVAFVGNVDWRGEIDDERRARFHEVWMQPAYDPSVPEHAAFLQEVIVRRAPDVFTDDVMAELVRVSGGFVREMLHLARSVVYESMDEGTTPTRATLDRAISATRDGKLAMLNEQELDALKNLERGAPLETAWGDRLQARGCAVLRGAEWQVHPLMRAPSLRSQAA